MFVADEDAGITWFSINCYTTADEELFRHCVPIKANDFKLLWIIFIKEGNRYAHHAFIIVWYLGCLADFDSVIIIVMWIVW